MGNTSFLERGIQAACLHACPHPPFIPEPIHSPRTFSSQLVQASVEPLLKGNLMGWRVRKKAAFVIAVALGSRWLACSVTEAPHPKCPGEFLLITSFPIWVHTLVHLWPQSGRGVPRGTLFHIHSILVPLPHLCRMCPSRGPGPSSPSQLRIKQMGSTHSLKVSLGMIVRRVSPAFTPCSWASLFFLLGTWHHIGVRSCIHAAFWRKAPQPYGVFLIWRFPKLYLWQVISMFSQRDCFWIL